jgi:uncharacterized SAM-binding protein YcdF (DUF218 family)
MKNLNAVIFTIVILSSFLLQSCASLYTTPKRTLKKNLTHQPFDAIIVPGVPYDGNQWSGTMKIRVHWSKYLYDQGYAKNIIYSGSAVYSPYLESKVMALHAEKLGIPTDKMLIEDKAMHSSENIYYSYVIAKNLGYKNIALATDPFQLNNMRYFIKKYQLPVKLLPIDFSIIGSMYLDNPEIDAEQAKVKDFIHITEKEKGIKRLKGTMGYNVVWHEEDLVKKRHRRRYKNRMISAER